MYGCMASIIRLRPDLETDASLPFRTREWWSLHVRPAWCVVASSDCRSAGYGAAADAALEESDQERPTTLEPVIVGLNGLRLLRKAAWPTASRT